MAYDDLDRLVGVTAGSAQGGNAVFAYDVLDNLRQLDQGTRTVRHQYNTSNRLSAVKNAAGTTLSTYVQDTRGNQVQRVTGAVTDTFTFDKANRLRGSNIGGVVNSYHYDGLGRRIRLQEGSNISHFFFSQAGQLLYNTEGATALRYNHIYLAGSLVAKRILPAAGGAATVRYQHTDALGSPIHETNESGALVPPSERLTAYGEPADGTWRSGPGFTGHQMDAGAKLVYMQQRYYDPAIGRFLSVDPVKTDPDSGDSFNRYSYAAGSPYVYIDPDGRRNGRANPNPDLRSLTPSQKAAITRIVAKSHGIDLGKVPVVTGPGDGAILGAEALFIYDESFRTRSNLAAVVGHEWEMHYKVHIEERDGSYSPTTEQYHFDEAEAFQYNIDNARRFGNTQAEAQGFRESRDGHAAAGKSLREEREKRAKERSKREREEDQK